MRDCKDGKMRLSIVTIVAAEDSKRKENEGRGCCERM